MELYSALFVVPHTQGAQAWNTQFYQQLTPHLPLRRKRSPDGATTDWGSRHLIAACYSFIDPERMKGCLVGWPRADGLPHKWLPASCRSSADRENSPVKDRRSTAAPRNQPLIMSSRTMCTNTKYYYSVRFWLFSEVLYCAVHAQLQLALSIILQKSSGHRARLSHSWLHQCWPTRCNCHKSVALWGQHVELTLLSVSFRRNRRLEYKTSPLHIPPGISPRQFSRRTISLFT